MTVLTSFRTELRTNPTLWRFVALSACGAAGSALPDIITLVRQVLL